jgi:signal transduction histidine kinase
MNAILSDLLLLTRLDAGKLSVEQETFDLSQVIIQAAERFRARAAAEGINIETKPSGKLLVLGDEERTGQILAALLDNAVRFTPESGSIMISGKREDRRIQASVTDTGPGIASEHLPRLFDRFYRAEASRTRSDGGTGLGLAIARDLARVQGGALEASNAENGGAVFTLQMPTG